MNSLRGNFITSGMLDWHGVMPLQYLSLNVMFAFSVADCERHSLSFLPWQTPEFHCRLLAALQPLRLVNIVVRLGQQGTG
jgi:hypothetical protein